MSKIHCDSQTKPRVTRTTHLPAVLSRCLVHLIGRVNFRKAAHITAQVLLSASLISGGILVGLNPIGAFLALTGFCLAFVQEEMTDEEYNESVREYFRERGQEVPKWALRGAAR